MTVVIVGAGMAGLAAAIDLAAQGFAVELVEKDDGAGGKMRTVQPGTVPIDSGPTVLTLADVFETLFADAGADLHRMVALTPASILARHVWPGGARLDLFADVERSADAIGALAGPGEARGYRSFLGAARAIFDTLDRSFMRADKPANPLALMWRGGVGGLAGFTQLDPYRSLWAMLGDHFQDPRLRQLFGRYTTYCGSSPFEAPATLALIAQVEQAGVWLVEGGMWRLAAAMRTLAERLGVATRFGAEVARVDVVGDRAGGVVLTDGTRIAADAVLVTADAAAVAAGCFGEPATGGVARFAARDRSFSAFTVACEADAGAAALVRHNVFFSNDGPAEFACLAKGRMPPDPTVYLCAQDRGAATGDDGPRDGPERMLLVLNAPADGDRHDYDETETLRWTNAALSRLEASGLTLTPCRSSISTPSDFARRFPATGGALYGRASHGWMASFRRPGARTKLPGLYLAGGSVHPGAGVPMAALSGRAAARAIRQDRASTSTFRKAATPGGMSTRSATADATA